MALTGDRHVGHFRGHTVEMVLNNWDKTFSLVVDGQTVAKQSRLLPKDIELKFELVHEGATHALVARSTVKPILGLPLREESSLEIDGQPFALKKVK